MQIHEIAFAKASYGFFTANPYALVLLVCTLGFLAYCLISDSKNRDSFKAGFWYLPELVKKGYYGFNKLFKSSPHPSQSATADTTSSCSIGSAPSSICPDSSTQDQPPMRDEVINANTDYEDPKEQDHEAFRNNI